MSPNDAPLAKIEAATENKARDGVAPIEGEASVGGVALRGRSKYSSS